MSNLTPYGSRIILCSRLEVDPKCMASSKNGEMRLSFVLTTSGSNENRQVFLEEDLKDPDVLMSSIGEPIDYDHEQSFMAVVGEIRDCEFVAATRSRPSAIKSYGVIFEDLYPDIAMKVRRGAGRWAAISMEAMPNPLEKVGQFLVIHKPKFVGAGLVRFPGNVHSKIEEYDDGPIPEQEIARHDRIKIEALKKGLDLLVARKTNKNV